MSSAIVPKGALPPEPGQLVYVRSRHWVVADISRSTQPPDVLAADGTFPQTLVQLTSVEDDAHGEDLRVIWDIEPGTRILDTATLPAPRRGHLDDHERLEAFLDAVRWGAVTSADTRALQAPFRSGITIGDYQLEPVVRALRMPRVNLLIADDVGLGKTIEAGLVIQELILRHRARTVLVVCPASLRLKWKAEMQEKFGLEFRIVDTELLKHLRRTRGLQANPWTHFPRLITSIDWLKRERPMRLMNEFLQQHGTGYPRAFDMLVIDEVHGCAPARRTQYSVDSQRTQAIRTLSPHFEHRVFLSATPHNGYAESFSGLLELLDPQRFARGVRPLDQQLAQVMVRRMKSELPPKPDGSPRFPKRTIRSLEVTYSNEDHSIHKDLVAYTTSRQQQVASRSTGAQKASDFVTLLLKKRLFSSPAAFAFTLAEHKRTLARKAATVPSPDRALMRAIERTDEDYESDQLFQEAEIEALAAATSFLSSTTRTQDELLSRMTSWAEANADRPDAKFQRLVRWLDETVRPSGNFNDDRVIIFTEYRDTQNWLLEHLAARGFSRERVALIFGGMDEQVRERTKAEFQAHPSQSPVRVLLATDAASEGIDLQRYCHRLVHYEIPFSPIRMEQRNGRIDRHGQPASEVLIHHFVGSGWESAPPRSFEADLEFLSRAARKIESIREDLGSAAPIIASQVEEAMLGRRRDFDDSAIQTRRASRQLLRIERNIREEVGRLREQLDESIRELHVAPSNVERVVQTGLNLARQPDLSPAVLHRRSDDPTPSSPVFRVGQLSHGWADATLDLPHPLTQVVRPITFDHAVAAEHDDVVLAHLGHRLVQLATQILRSEIWAEVGQSKLARVTARVVPTNSLERPAVVAHARLVITGVDGHRLHEEIITAGGLVANRNFRRMLVGELGKVLAAADGTVPSEAAVDDLIEQWDAYAPSLLNALRVRADDRMLSLEKALRDRADEEVNTITTVLTDLRRQIETELRTGDVAQVEQMSFGWAEEEREQLRRDVEALRRRIDAIPGEITAEVAHIRRRYEQPQLLLFPAAVTLLIPEGVR